MAQQPVDMTVTIRVRIDELKAELAEFLEKVNRRVAYLNGSIEALQAIVDPPQEPQEPPQE